MSLASLIAKLDENGEPLRMMDDPEKRAAVTHFALEDPFEVAPETPADVLAELREYFHTFATPTKGKHGAECPNCGSAIGGMFGSFEWGLVHGEGRCSICHWPMRAYHFIKDKDGKDVATIRNLVLPYHPDFVTKRSK